MHRPYTLEIIVRGSNGTHTFEDSICECILSGNVGRSDNHKIGRYVYNEEGDKLKIRNDFCEITLRVWRDPETISIHAEVIDQRVFIKRPQWGRFWRRPKPLTA